MDFFALLREMERSTPDAPRFGTLNDGTPTRLRIRQTADLAFASREVAAVREHNSRYDISLRHFGLFAPYGPLPISVTEHARNEQLSLNSEAFGDFLAFLTQRQALLWYRAWSQLQPMTGFDRAASDNRFQQKLKQIAGITEDIVGDETHKRLRQNWPAAWLPGRASLRDLQNMLGHYFQLPIQLFPFEGHWITPRESEPLHRMGRLCATRLGKRFFDAQHALRIEIGPLTPPDWPSWQRGGERLLELASMCQMFVRHQLQINIDLLMKTSSSQSQTGLGKLGRSCWLKPCDAVVRQRVWQTPA
jgi:type VI secretion system protein ImpH